MSRFKWLHYELALPILATLDVPGILKVYDRFFRALAPFKGQAAEPTITEVMVKIDRGLLDEAMALMRTLDGRAVRKLAMISSCSVDEVEEFMDSPAKEKELMSRVARMEPSEVIAYVLFFMGTRTNAGGDAPGSSASETTETDQAPESRITDSSAAS